MLLNNGENWEPTPKDVDKWKDLYPTVDVEQEIRSMSGWLDTNPKKRKTPRGVKRFCVSWLARAQDKGGSPMANKASSGQIKTRDMSLEDDLSHNFVNCPKYRIHCLEKYGQVFENGKRFTV